MLSTWCTGTQLLDIYRKELEVQAETLRSSYPNLSSLKDDDTRLFGLMDVMYAGAGNFKIGTIDDAINAGRELTLDDFLSNCTSENAFYNQICLLQCTVYTGNRHIILRHSIMFACQFNSLPRFCMRNKCIIKSGGTMPILRHIKCRHPA